MQEQKLNNYISLDEATKYCEYSQEYLSLRARQKKLKSVKMGRNWFTTKEWLKEYVLEVDSYKKNLKTNRVVIEEVKSVKTSVPVNLPIGDFELLPVRPLSYRLSQSVFFKKALATGLFLLLIIAGSVLGKSVIQKFAQQDEINNTAVYGTINTFKEYAQWVVKETGLEAVANEIENQGTKEIKNTKSFAKVTQPFTEPFYCAYLKLSSVFGEAGISFFKTMSSGWEEIKSGWFAIVDYFDTSKYFVKNKTEEVGKGIADGVDYLTEPWTGMNPEPAASPSAKTGKWMKVKNIQEGMEIAIVADGAVWDKIVKIENLPEEQVYDIEVANTHNFVGNGIIAHNTYIDTSLITPKVIRGTTTTSDLSFQTTSGSGATEAMTILNNGNVGIGTTGPGGSGTVGSAVLSLANGTAPVGGVANQSSIYASDTLGSSELWVLNEAGDVTQISPHDPTTGDWIFLSTNNTTGKELRVEMEQLVKFIDQQFGTSFVQELLNGEVVEGLTLGEDGTIAEVAGELEMSTDLLTTLTKKIRDTLEWLGMRFEDGVAFVREIVTDKLTAKTARFEKMEMVDSETGKVYCTWIADGEWQKMSGDCDSIYDEEPEDVGAIHESSDILDTTTPSDIEILDTTTPSN